MLNLVNEEKLVGLKSFIGKKLGKNLQTELL